MAKINVVFNDSTGESSASEQTTQQSNQSKSNEKTASYLIGQSVVQLGKRVLSYGVGQIGNLTGDYIMQNKIDNAIQVLGYAGQIGAGFATGGVVGGVVSTIAVVGQIGLNAVSYEIERSKSNTQSRFLAETRGGILNNGSR